MGEAAGGLAGESLRDWVMRPDEQALMDMAIFYDAAAVAGRAELVALAKPFLFELAAGNQAFLARFAQATLMFRHAARASWAACSPAGEERLDIKKAGIFPLVHGTRALALEQRLTETGTIQRIRRLTEQGLFDRRTASSWSTPSLSSWACACRRAWSGCGCTSRRTTSSTRPLSPSSSATPQGLAADRRRSRTSSAITSSSACSEPMLTRWRKRLGAPRG